MDTILKKIVEGTAAETGEGFFNALVKNLAMTLDVPAAWVTEYVDEYRQLRGLAFWLDGELTENVEFMAEGTPCAAVLDRGLNITLLNSAAENAFQVKAKKVLGRHFSDFLSQDTFPHLRNLTQGLSSVNKGAAHRWVPEILTAVCTDGSTFPTEATLSCSDNHGRISFTLILRNINDRLVTEEKIRTLSIETEHLKEEIRALGNFDNIIGTSIPLMKILKDVDQVAPTDATVLIYGETGTGKELIAWAIHEASQKRERAMVKVNCAAIPAGPEAFSEDIPIRTAAQIQALERENLIRALKATGWQISGKKALPTFWACRRPP